MKVKIVSFNVRCLWDSEDGFVSRMGLIYDKIEKEQPDVVAFQEITPVILRALKQIMPGYLFVGHGRGPDYQGEGLYLALRESSMKLIGLDTFWIAPNPYDKLSRYEDQSSCPRICVGATLYHAQTGTELRVFDVHLDHRGSNAQQEGMKCVLEKVAEANRRFYAPTVILGDFNVLPENPVCQICAAWQEPPTYDITEKLPGTFHGYGSRGEAPDMKIDYIYVTKELRDQNTDTCLWTERLNGHFLSDHYPVCAEFEL